MQVLIEKSVNSDKKQLELEITIRRKYLDTGKIFDTFSPGYKCFTYNHLNSRFKYGSKSQPTASRFFNPRQGGARQGEGVSTC